MLGTGLDAECFGSCDPPDPSEVVYYSQFTGEEIES